MSEPSPPDAEHPAAAPPAAISRRALLRAALVTLLAVGGGLSMAMIMGLFGRRGRRGRRRPREEYNDLPTALKLLGLFLFVTAAALFGLYRLDAPGPRPPARYDRGELAD